MQYQIKKILSLLPKNDPYGILISVIALMINGEYTDENGNRKKITEEEMSWLNSLLFYREKDHVSYLIINPNENPNHTDNLPENKCRINCFGREPIIFDRRSSLNNIDIAKICLNLGFETAGDLFALMYGISSNLMILKS